MERKQTVLGAAAELFDLPPDVVAGVPRVELAGRRQLYLEHHGGLAAYSPERIDARTGIGTLRINGLDLSLLAITPEALRVGGTILSVEWMGGGRT